MKNLDKVYLEFGEFYINIQGENLDDTYEVKSKIRKWIGYENLTYLRLRYCSKRQIGPNIFRVKLKKHLSCYPEGTKKEFTKEEIKETKKRLKFIEGWNE